MKLREKNEESGQSDCPVMEEKETRGGRLANVKKSEEQIYI